ncbi:MAG: hypothetical protein Q8L98_06225 [Chlamydiales bacterium]|nr:hypothetical protein [Chlamydiales bacterium]
MSINVNYKEISSFSDLSLRIFGTGSEEMNRLATEEFEKRNLELGRLLSSFVTTRTFNIEKITETRVFLLGETHGDEDARLKQSKLVYHLARRAFVVFAIEGFPSMQFCNRIFEPVWEDSVHDEPQPLLDSLDEPTKQNIHGIGWDSNETLNPLFKEQINLVREEEGKVVEKLFNKAEVLSDFLPEECDIDCLVKKKCEERDPAEELSYLEKIRNVLETLAVFNTRLCEFMDTHRVIFDSNLLSLYMIWGNTDPAQSSFLMDQAKNMSRFLPKGFKVGDVLLEVLDRRGSVGEGEIISEVLPIFNKRLKQLIKDHFKIVDHFATIEKKFLSWQRAYSNLELLKLEDLRLREKEDEEIVRMFPSRTVSMADTLSKIKYYMAHFGIEDYFVVVQAGAYHLEQSKKEPGVEHNLTPLYTELAHHKAVILLPPSVLSLYPDQQFPASEKRRRAIGIENLLD